MNEQPHRPARIGDQVHDATTGHAAIVIDGQQGVPVLRPLYDPGGRWTAADPARLTVTVTREQRSAQGRI